MSTFVKRYNTKQFLMYNSFKIVFDNFCYDSDNSDEVFVRDSFKSLLDFMYDKFLADPERSDIVNDYVVYEYEIADDVAVSPAERDSVASPVSP